MSMQLSRWMGLACWVLVGAGVGAQAAPPATLDAALVRIAELEARVADLESQLAAAGVETQRLEVVAGLEPKADLAASAAARFDVRYDAAGDTTTVVGPVLAAASNQGLSNARFLIAPAVAFAGQKPARPVPSFDLFVATRGHAHNRLRTVKTAALWIDGAAVQVPVVEYREEGRLEPPRSAGRARRGAVAYDERLKLVLDRAVMTRLAHATEAALGFDGLQLALTREHLAVVRATLLHGTPAE